MRTYKNPKPDPDIETPPVTNGPEVMRVKFPVPLGMLSDLSKFCDRHFGKGCTFSGSGEFMFIYGPLKSEKP